ncbi:MAG: hypothetical protein ACI9WL_000397 [Rubritalea sp.]|jgi:hypothetical protein
MKLKLLLKIWLFISGFFCFGSFFVDSVNARTNAIIITCFILFLNFLVFVIYKKKVRLIIFKLVCVGINLIFGLVLLVQLYTYSFVLIKKARDIITSTEIINLTVSFIITILPSIIVYKTIKLSKENYINENN